jgi:hypothetical protein
MIPPAGGPGTTIISGYFDATGGVRVGTGQWNLTLEELRTAGVILKDLDKLTTLTVDYNTRDWPRVVELSVVNVPPVDATDAARATYHYERAENGDGAMRFSVVQDVLKTTAAMETLAVESRWLGTGPGRADVSVTGGDVVGGANTLECWDAQYQSTYKFQSWLPDAPVGDAATCIPRP